MDKATKEKILEMAKLCDGCLERSFSDFDGCYSCENRGTYYGALKMAEWKQKQMVEKAVKWLKENESSYWSEEVATPEELLDDFRKAMWEE